MCLQYLLLINTVGCVEALLPPLKIVLVYPVDGIPGMRLHYGETFALSSFKVHCEPPRGQEHTTVGSIIVNHWQDSVY